jgi:hypothetical protein
VDGGSTRGGVEASSRVRAGAVRSADAVVLSPRPRLPHETRRVAAEGSAGVGGWLRPVGGVGPFGAAGLDLSRRGAGNPRYRCAVRRSDAFFFWVRPWWSAQWRAPLVVPSD